MKWGEKRLFWAEKAMITGLFRLILYTELKWSPFVILLRRKKGEIFAFFFFGMYLYCMCRIEIAFTFNVTFCIVSRLRIQISSFCGLKIDSFLFETRNCLTMYPVNNCMENAKCFYLTVARWLFLFLFPFVLLTELSQSESNQSCFAGKKLSFSSFPLFCSILRNCINQFDVSQ